MKEHIYKVPTKGYFLNSQTGKLELRDLPKPMKQSKEMEWQVPCGKPSILPDGKKHNCLITRPCRRHETQKEIMEFISQNFTPHSQAISKSEVGEIYTILEIATVDLPRAKKLLDNLLKK